MLECPQTVLMLYEPLFYLFYFTLCPYHLFIWSHPSHYCPFQIGLAFILLYEIIKLYGMQWLLSVKNISTNLVMLDKWKNIYWILFLDVILYEEFLSKSQTIALNKSVFPFKPTEGCSLWKVCVNRNCIKICHHDNVPHIFDPVMVKWAREPLNQMIAFETQFYSDILVFFAACDEILLCIKIIIFIKVFKRCTFRKINSMYAWIVILSPPRTCHRLTTSPPIIPLQNITSPPACWRFNLWVCFLSVANQPFLPLPSPLWVGSMTFISEKYSWKISLPVFGYPFHLNQLYNSFESFKLKTWLLM